MWTIIGVTLCIAIFIYLAYVARKAVDEELDDEAAEDEERLAFLPAQRTAERDSHANTGIERLSMAESPFSPHMAPRQLRLDGHDNRATFGFTRDGDGQGNIAL